MQVFKSRRTPGVTGDEILLRQGEKVAIYRGQGKGMLSVIIQSERMSHDKCVNLGYEVEAVEGHRRFFADGKSIVSWDGKISKTNNN